MIAALAFVALAGSTAVQADDLPQPPAESRPYRIKAWIAVDPAARLGPGGRDGLVVGWSTLVRRFVGAPWRVEVAEGEGPSSASAEPDAVAIGRAAEGFDKAWLIRVGPGAGPGGAGLVLEGREYDAATGLVGPPHSRSTPYALDAPRALLALALDLFAPVADVGEESGGGVSLVIRGGALGSADPIGRVAGPGTVFRPFTIARRGDQPEQVRAIPFTYLKVESIEGGRARCAIVSSLRNPFPKQIAGRFRRVALGARPGSSATRLRFVAGKDRLPAAGYILTARPAPDAPEREVATTDREGRVALPTGFASGLSWLRLKAGVEPLAEFPILPGESADERTVAVTPRPQAVALEAKLDALRDELVDLIARRGRLEARMKARADGEAWDEVRTLVTEFRALPPRTGFEDRLNRLRDAATRDQEQLKIPVLTRTAQAELAEVESLILRYLADDEVDAYDAAARAATDLAAPKAAAPAQVAPKSVAPAPARPQAAPATTPPPASPSPPPSRPKAVPF